MLKDLFASQPFTGELIWIGLRPAYRQDLSVVEEVEAITDAGLVGDHTGAQGLKNIQSKGKNPSKRQVTLIQAEHLDVVARLLEKAEIEPELLRRNLVVRGINLHALKKARFRIGEVLFEGTGDCHPCSRMEEVLGPGGYNAMRGHGGITARVLEGGILHLADVVRLETPLEFQG
ncbi:MOSC domain-containing protein [Deinococcus cellulosilyticus]|uniref:Molybdenum cofactor biosysynthesis protein n=1 Tax=Deinococcus cellulosilyticus (strain DSM 18568 / NBRC 106333 / KACC 11606 / 5516J-15) TaxID=1223518 RepID=A0A511N6I5_DEIC1|nr:MOSC domain-containing protein [Deinococcus cellulosilyticus]GEM48470.1 molybdenum cofactor biosysynthesis protein [Deinococcus cellulosilyticus NBRC 106333 = KACC 11606]